MTDLRHTVRMILREEGADNRVIDTEYGPTAHAAVDDPYVRTRIAPTNQAEPSQLITEFAPAPSRPVSYPVGLPFIPDRAVWTTESPSGTNLDGARWPCTDADVLLAAVVSASVTDGWRVIAAPPREQRLGDPDVVLKRDNMFRELQVFPLNEQWLLQLWDVPDSLFGTPKT